MNHDTQLDLPFDHEPFHCEEDYLNYLEAKAVSLLRIPRPI